MTGLWAWRTWRMGGALALALALALRLAAPDGWMLAAGPGGAALVICTGHGPATLAGHPDGHGAPDRHDSHPCVGAGVHAPPAPVLAAALATPIGFSAETPPPSQLSDQRPGLGLAAPPPPSQGPPDIA